MERTHWRCIFFRSKRAHQSLSSHLLLCKTSGLLARSAGTLLSFVHFVCPQHARLKEKKDFLLETLPDGYLCSCEAVKGTFDISLRHPHSPSAKPSSHPLSLCRTTHTSVTHTQRCTAVYPHQCTVDLGFKLCDPGGRNSVEVMVKINPGD